MLAGIQLLHKKLYEPKPGSNPSLGCPFWSIAAHHNGQKSAENGLLIPTKKTTKHPVGMWKRKSPWRGIDLGAPTMSFL